MKFFLYLGLVTISFAIGECLQCYNCYHGPELRNADVNNWMPEDRGTHTPNAACVMNNGAITGPICENSNACAHLNAILNGEETHFYFCLSRSTINYGEGSFASVKGNEHLEVFRKFCYNGDFCNGASSIFTTEGPETDTEIRRHFGQNAASVVLSTSLITSLTIALVLLLLFSRNL